MKIFIDTYGCALNKADARIIKAALSDHDFFSLEKSDIVIINTCAVKNTTISRMLAAINNYLEQGKKIIVAGCLPKIDYNLIRHLPVSVVDTNSYENISLAVDSEKKGSHITLFSGVHKNKVAMPHFVDDSKAVEVEICEGCLGKCAFCGTKNARGNLTSYPVDNILCYVKSVLDAGAKEIRLTSQDTGCYGIDIGTNLIELVKKICALPYNFKVRIGMMNPRYAVNMLPELLDLFENNKIVQFIHIPVQSGSDKVLKSMHRNHTSADYSKVASAFRCAFPNIYFVTDIIVGFPTETEKDFQLTLNLIKKTKPNKVHMSVFHPHPDTEAKTMKQLSTQVKKERSVRLFDVVRHISRKASK